MKKQNVNGKLAFNKAAILELNESAMIGINGGDGWGDAAVAIAQTVGKLLDQANAAGNAVGYAITTHVR